LALTIPYYLTIASLGKIDLGAVWCGYLALLLVSSVYLGIGLFTSALSNNQIVGLLVALFIGIFFHFIFSAMASGFKGITGEIFSYLSVKDHYESMARGVIDTKDLIFFFSLTFLGLFASEAIMAKRKLID